MKGGDKMNKKELLLDLYKKIKNGSATDQERFRFKLLLNISSLNNEYIIQELEKLLR